MYISKVSVTWLHYFPRLVLILALRLFITCSSEAMDLPHYDVNSLVYMSTDIVMANLSRDAEHNFTATVTETLYGSLEPGDRVDKLNPFLTFFQPMEDGMRLLLFLDRRPQQYDFFHANAANSPFAVPPSGVYLIDGYGHVHEYYQQNNPGPYVAQGYMYFPEKSVPSQEEDLALPSLEQVKSRIAMAIKTVQPVRPLLDKVPELNDTSALINLVDISSQSDKDCDLRFAAAIRERVIAQVRSMNDPGLLLKAYAIANISNSGVYDVSFVEPADSRNVKEFEADRVRYLIDTLSNKRQDDALRVAAVQILASLSKFHSGSQSGPSLALPIDNQWLISFAEEIQAISKRIFNDASQKPNLRGLSLQFLPLDRRKTLADVKRVYKRTHSEELRFAIEKSFLEVSDSLYQSLDPPGGPVASRISTVRKSGCAKLADRGIVFLLDYRARSDFPLGDVVGLRTMTNKSTGQHFLLKNVAELYGWSSVRDGQSEFELGTLSEFPVGQYSLALEYTSNDKVVSTGYGPQLVIREGPLRKEISIIESAKTERGLSRGRFKRHSENL